MGSVAIDPAIEAGIIDKWHVRCGGCGETVDVRQGVGIIGGQWLCTPCQPDTMGCCGAESLAGYERRMAAPPAGMGGHRGRRKARRQEQRRASRRKRR